MASFTQAASHFIADHRAWAGLVLGAIAFGESMMIIGAFLPATVLLFVAGGLIAAGVIDPAPVVLWTVAGAVLGDAVSYSIGRRLGLPLLRHRVFRGHGRILARTRLAMQKLGPTAIYLGRFAGPLRATIPMMAGMLSMPARRFHVANALSGLVWVIVFMSPGYLAARGVDQLSRIDPQIVLDVGFAAGGLLVATGATIWSARRLSPRPVVPAVVLEASA